MTEVMTEALEALIDQEKRAAGSKGRFLDRIRNAPNRGAKGTIGWSRKELHER